MNVLQVERLARSLLPPLVFPPHVLSSCTDLWAGIDRITRGSDFNWFFRTVMAHREFGFFDEQRLIKISPRTGE